MKPGERVRWVACELTLHTMQQAHQSGLLAYLVTCRRYPHVHCPQFMTYEARCNTQVHHFRGTKRRR